MGCVIRIHHESQLVNSLCYLPNDVLLFPLLFRPATTAWSISQQRKPNMLRGLYQLSVSYFSLHRAGSPNRSSNQRHDAASYHQEAGMKF